MGFQRFHFSICFNSFINSENSYKLKKRAIRVLNFERFTSCVIFIKAIPYIGPKICAIFCSKSNKSKLFYFIKLFQNSSAIEKPISECVTEIFVRKIYLLENCYKYSKKRKKNICVESG